MGLVPVCRLSRCVGACAGDRVHRPDASSGRLGLLHQSPAQPDGGGSQPATRSGLRGLHAVSLRPLLQDLDRGLWLFRL